MLQPLLHYLGLSLILLAGANPVDPAQILPGKEAKKESVKWVEEITALYRNATSVQMDIEKNVAYVFLDQKQASKGKLLLQQKKFRMELKGDEDSLVVVNDGKVRVFTYFPKDSGLKTQVLETSFEKKGHVQGLFSALFSGEGFATQFVIEKSEQQNQQIQLTLKPRNEAPEISKILLTASATSYHIEEISIWDNLQNQTKYTMKKPVFDKSIEAKLFDVPVPKDAVLEKF